MMDWLCRIWLFEIVKLIDIRYWKCYFLISPHVRRFVRRPVGWLVGLLLSRLVGQSVGRSNGHNFLKGREVTFLCSFRSTCRSMNESKLEFYIWLIDWFIYLLSQDLIGDEVLLEALYQEFINIVRSYDTLCLTETWREDRKKSSNPPFRYRGHTTIENKNTLMG